MLDDGLGAGTGEGLQEGLLVPNTDPPTPTTITGNSLAYRVFSDLTPNPDIVLNEGAAIVRQRSETAHGIGWSLPDDWTGGAAVIYAVRVDINPPDVCAVTDGGLILTSDGHQVRLDWTDGAAWPVGTLQFHARLTKVLNDETYIDTTSGILVKIEYDPF